MKNKKMQMMRKDSGVTLVALVITIVVLFIILSITVNYGLSTIHQVSNEKIESELSIVQEALIQNYTLLRSTGETGIKPSSTTSITDDDTKKPSELIGTRIVNISELTGVGFTEYRVSYENISDLTYEQYYYKLNEDDLALLGIEKGSDVDVTNTTSKDVSYIVNYSTGEVFDIGNKKYYDTDTYDTNAVYTSPSDSTVTLDSYDFSE
jgi:type II secretory pathway pseudopilin PulG